MSQDVKLTAFQRRALELIRDKQPANASELGEALWPDRRFKNAQGAALAGGGQAGKLEKLKLIRRNYERVSGKLWPRGWVLTVEGRRALGAA